MRVTIDQIDNAVLGMIGDAPRAIVDLVGQGGSPGTIRNAPARLLKAQLVKRQWDGNERYGRYVYVLASSPLEHFYFA